MKSYTAVVWWRFSLFLVSQDLNLPNGDKFIDKEKVKMQRERKKLPKIEMVLYGQTEELCIIASINATKYQFEDKT